MGNNRYRNLKIDLSRDSELPRLEVKKGFAQRRRALPIASRISLVPIPATGSAIF
jgi:hypothetical protein